MPAIQRSEFALALNQVSTERGIDPSIVVDAVKNAILAAYKKDHPDVNEEEYTAELDQNTGEAKILKDGKDVTPPGFGRIAAQTAKQVILQKIREKEKEVILTDYRARIGSIVNGMVLRFAGPNIIIDIGKTEGIMPPAEQIANERYHLNQRIVVYLVGIEEGTKGEEIIVSRAHSGLLQGLFKREVPEVSQGSVEIKAIVREAGNRSKVAVYSNQSGIDPVGSCVGQKGVRVQAIIAEFGGLEKIDIIQWSENIKQYVGNSLSPAKNLTVEIDEKEKLAKIKIAPEELSLAIGKDGQNVRLASKLTGFRIEIEEDKTLAKEPIPQPSSGQPTTLQDDAQVVQTKTKEEAQPSLSETRPTESIEDKKEPQSVLNSPASDQPPAADEVKLPSTDKQPETGEGQVAETADQDQTVSENVQDEHVATEPVEPVQTLSEEETSSTTQASQPAPEAQAEEKPQS